MVKAFKQIEKNEVEKKIAEEKRFIVENIHLFPSQDMIDDEKVIPLFLNSENTPDQVQKEVAIVCSEGESHVPLKMVLPSQEDDFWSNQLPPSPIEFQKRRQAVKSRFLSTPYEKHVGSSKLPESDTKLLMFAWNENEDCFWKNGKSFDENWDKKGRTTMEKENNKFRRETCLSILKSFTNEIQKEVQTEANLFCEKKIEEILKANNEKQAREETKKQKKRKK
ncbi:hypothetical protein LIER_10597 [Lithospermum erythrorhizon]|uniref:Uncharacterized protein n=1 Tax=Lithospermum erythrorhizon TaxID=34254 RepID=A0AAV3PLW7_LITER